MLGMHCRWVKEGTCRHCDDQSFEDGHHVFFDCPAYVEARRDLESAMFKLGYKQETLLNPPREHLHEVVLAMIKFLKEPGCLDRV